MKIKSLNEIIIGSIKKSQYDKYLELMPDLKLEKNAKLITAILTITASIILGVFAINPTLSTIVGLQKQLDDSRNFESKLEEKINDLAILDQKYQTLESDLPIVYLAVPKTSDIATLAGSFQTIIGSSNVTLKNLQELKADLSGQPDAGKNYSSYQFGLTLQGNYQDLIAVLEKVVNFQRILTIDTVSFIKTATAKESVLTININGKAYFKK